MYSILVVVNKHNTARVASCWFIIYYRLVMQGNSNIKFVHFVLIFLFDSCAICEVMWKNVVDLDRSKMIIRRTHFACLMTKAKIHTHTQNI